MDIDNVLQDISTNIIEPNSEDPEILKMYKRGASLKREVAGELIPKLKNLKEDKVYEIILFIEQLNHQLNKEYED